MSKRLAHLPGRFAQSCAQRSFRLALFVRSDLSLRRASAFRVDGGSLFGKSLERFPLGWNHPSDKKSLQINKLEHVLFAKPRTVLRNML